MEAQGYRGIGPEEGIFVDKKDAFAYALSRCLSGTEEEQEEFREMLEEWFFSSNWLFERDENDE